MVIVMLIMIRMAIIIMERSNDGDDYDVYDKEK